MATHPDQFHGGREREEHLYSILCDLARNDKPLPRIPDLGPVLGVTGNGSVHNILDRLAASGRIVVEGFGTTKVVHIPALGLNVPAGANPNGERRRAIADILALVARVACLPVEVITGPRRSRLELRPRYVVIRLARAEGWPFEDIGRAIGRDHSSVINGWQRSADLLPHDKLLNRLLRRAEAELAGLPEPVFAISLRPVPPPQLVPAARHPVEIDEDDWRQVADMNRRRRGSAGLLAAIKREFPERCAA